MTRTLLALLIVVLSAPACFAQSDLLAVHPFTDDFFVLDRTTGVASFEGKLTIGSGPVTGTVTGATGAALHPTTHEIFVVLKVSGVTGRALATLERTTGVCTTIGNLGDNFSCLAFDSAGVLYGTTGNGATVPETMFTINTATAVTTVKQALGNGADGEVIGFNPVDGLMYHSSGNGTIVFETIDLTSGTVTNVPVTWGGETFGLLWDPEQSLFLKSNINSVLSTVTAAGVEVVGPGLTSVIVPAIDARGLVLLPSSLPSTPTLNLGSSPAGAAGSALSFSVEGHHLWDSITVTAPAGVELSLTMAGAYGPSLVLAPAAGVVASTTIFARVTAAAAPGAIADDIMITSSGADDTVVAVTATVTPPAPEMNVMLGLASIPDGGTDLTGPLTAGPLLSNTFIVQNIGSLVLNLTGTPVVVATAGANTQDVAVVAQPAATVAIGGSVSFTVNYRIVGAGAFDLSISIANDDSDENPYNWTLGGTGVIAPEMNVTRGGAIAVGGTDPLGSRTPGVAITLTYTISNPGTAALNLTTPVVPGTLVNCTASVTTQPAAVVAAAGSTTLELTVTSTAAGIFSFAISIANDDPNENPYTWTVSGTGVAPGGGDDNDDDDKRCSVSSHGGSALGLFAAALMLALGARMRRSHA